MDQLLSNPRGLVIICCVGVLVLSLNVTLISLLRGDKTFQRQASRWGKALGGGREAGRRQEAEAAELNRLVRQIQEAEQKGQEPPHDE